MKKFSFWLLLVLAATMLWNCSKDSTTESNNNGTTNPPSTSEFAGGTGTDASPWLISTAAQLNNIRKYLGDAHSDKYFKLSNNIDLAPYLSSGGAGYTTWGAAGWLPVGNDTNQFLGHFDGADKIISGLKINRPSTNSIGFFGCIGENVRLKNIGFTGANVKGGSNTGGIIGTNYGIVQRCYFTGSISTNTEGYNIGGLVGFSYGGLISQCYFNGSINNQYCSNISVGGLVGKAQAKGKYTPAGIQQSYDKGYIYGGRNVGGLVGSLYSGSISDCFSTALVNGSNYIGGLVGYAGSASGFGNSSIGESYASGKVEGNYGSAGTSSTGGIIGYYETKSSKYLSNCYWDTQTTGQTNNYGSSGSSTYGGKTTAEMKQQSTFTSWDFTGELTNGSGDYWCINATINNGYPYLITAP